MTKNLLLIFIKNPIPGKVKTRLAKTVGDEEALKIYRFLLEKTRDSALACQAERWLFYSDALDEHDDFPSRKFFKKLQRGDDLGQRMENAFREAFFHPKRCLRHGGEKVVIIGSDCPEISEKLLDEAFQLLDNQDFVLGPTVDGGYYLLGMNRFFPEVFKDVNWSTETVFSKTMEIIQGMGKRAAILPMLSDVDTEKDWKKVSVRENFQA